MKCHGGKRDSHGNWSPAGQRFWNPDPVLPRYLLPRPGPDRKIVNFMAPTPDRPDYIFPGPDRTETI